MKKTFFTLCLAVFVLSLSLEAQSPELKDAFTAKRLLVDYQTPALNDLADFETYSSGLELGYTRNLNRAINLNIPLKVRSVNLPNGNGGVSSRKAAIGLDALIQLQYFREKNWFNPYLLAGLGGEYLSDEDPNFAAPVGVGVNIRLWRQFYIQVQSEYRIGFSKNRDNLMHGIGIMVPFGKITPPPPPDSDDDGISDAEDKCPLVAGVLSLGGCPDADRDGIADQDDKCPNEMGPKALDGCPDGDNDGIADSDDACPGVAGLSKYNGCPDTDNDGIIDGDDKCPNEAGPADNEGCPLNDADNDGVVDADDLCPNAAGSAANRGCPDTDNDGVIDREDKCPTSAGPASNNGCPVISTEDKETLTFAVQNVNFRTGNSVLLSESNAVLDKIMDIMQRYTDYSLSIGGHTDSVGNVSSNQKLSEKRAKACYDYLISKGIAPSRISYVGYGETQPIATNKYKDGREKNRRVEFNLYLK